MEAVVDKNNDVADSRVQWSGDDGELLLLKQNPDEDSEGYTEMSASLELDLKAGFFRDIIEKAEKEQADKGFKYPIPDTIYGNGTLGGLAVLTDVYKRQGGIWSWFSRSCGQRSGNARGRCV